MKQEITVSPPRRSALFAAAAAEARRTGRSRLVSVSFAVPKVDPIEVFAAARAREEAAMLWQLPSGGIALIGIGAETTLTGSGPERFAHVARQWRELTDGATVLDETGVSVVDETGSVAGNAAPPDPIHSPDHPVPGPIAMGGFAFAPGGASGPWTGFGDGRLTLPRMTYGVVGNTPWLTINTVVTVGEAQEADAPEARARALQTDWHAWVSAWSADRGPGAASSKNGNLQDAVLRDRAESGLGPAEDWPPKNRWQAAVERVVTDIRAGNVEKAVLARSVRIKLSNGFSVAAALRRLRADYPETYVFAIADDDGCFLGATPERIVHLAGGLVKVACMAGSIGRGATEAEDRTLGETLLKDAKNIEEHKVVLRSILDALATVCEAVTAGAAPGLRKFANVQHLYTPVTARTNPDVDILELVSRVHPTPAIGGHPTARALEIIAREEELARGWYAGPVGWMNARGEGEFAVGLRSGLLRDGEARLFAGCGIMGDSDPESEYSESVLKLRAMRRALEAGA